ncbi:iron-sulfur cluster assembly protein NAR1 [Ascoidea rubescens DSM 1968]|uniref:Cytosolic Fe-S cluster assembly factor NAR1 n=1 Tax=Ascoidea rubescens DSM 1968 TaxID=1344418 RepID=A0A1D2VG86_9ASCO|nr:iron hydrogenase [Ascoidea rubescens DSM 1968]ODV60599.1 iron hydrogenase [Ascoidea rubescens DSM 1968]
MSAILSADDLNDFITPGLACIKPDMITRNKNQNSKQETQDIEHENEYEIKVTDTGVFEISKDGSRKTLDQVNISLTDCLACSGCITSAEEILISNHSHKKLISDLEENKNNTNKKQFAVSISNQTRASLANSLNLSIYNIDLLLIDFFIDFLKFQYIVGTELARVISLYYSIQDIINKQHNTDNEKTKNSKGPLLSSICPGWVCYAEKTHPFILSQLSDIKSEQQIIGTILKNLVSSELNCAIDNVYHLSIMPCFDKKLEAARPEKFGQQDSKSGDNNNSKNNNNNQGRDVDVDCVITAKELIQLMIEMNYPVNEVIEKKFDNFYLKNYNLDEMNEIYLKYLPKKWPIDGIESWGNNFNGDSTSGNYSYIYLLYLQKKLKKEKNMNNTKIIKINGKNSDIYEYHLVNLDDNNNKLGSASVINGFKNIQNLIRKLKTNSSNSNSNGVIGNGSVKPKRMNGLVAKRRARELSKKRGNAGRNGRNGNDINGGVSGLLQVDPVSCDFVEVMACPSGCINGGGQINGSEQDKDKNSDKALKKNIEDSTLKYEDIEKIKKLDFIENDQAEAKMTEFIKMFCKQYKMEENRFLRTGFNEVVSNPDTIIFSKW